MGHEVLLHCRRDVRHVALEALRRPRQEVRKEQRDIIAALGVEGPLGQPVAPAEQPGFALPERLERYEAEILKEVLRAQRGDVKATIEALGIPRKTFYDKLQRHGINRADYAERGVPEKSGS